MPTPSAASLIFPKPPRTVLASSNKASARYGWSSRKKRPSKKESRGVVVYEVQVGAFEHEAHAQAVLAQVQDWFPSAYMTPRQGPEGPYSGPIGPFTDSTPRSVSLVDHAEAPRVPR